MYATWRSFVLNEMGWCFRWFFSSSFSWLPNGRGNMIAFFPYCKSIKACENFWQEPLAQCVIWSQSCPSIIFIPLVKIFAVNSREATLTGRWLHSWKKVAVFLAAILIWRELCFLEKKPRNTLCGVLFSTEFQFLTILNEIS